MKLGILSSSLLNFLFPAFCLHCDAELFQPRGLFCKECLTLFELLDPQEHCLLCFSSLGQSQGRICFACQKRSFATRRLASAFTHSGPAAAFVHRLKYGHSPYLAKSAAAFMLMQFLRLDWPLPDLIVPVPQSRLRAFRRGYNQSLLLAQHLGKLLERPVADVLKRHSGGFSQSGLTKEQRLALSATCFSWKKNQVISDKIILLVDDVLTTGTTLNHCAERLQEGFPAHIYGLTFCRAD